MLVTIAMEEETIESEDGTKLWMQSWVSTPQRPCAVFAIVHGLLAHSGLYDWPATELSDRDAAVYAIDLRGHGKSDGERYYVDKMSDYVADVSALVTTAKTRHPGVPVFLLGHSAGGVVSCIYVLDHQHELAGFICESFAHEVPQPDIALAVIKGLSHLAPHAHLLKLKPEDFSRVPAFVERMKTDPLIPRQGYPTQTVAELVRADERLRRDFGKITLPLLIIHGTADRVTKPHGSEVFAECAGSTDKTLTLYEDHVHDLLNDIGKERVLADITEWAFLRARGALL
jgi:alpha-beta hydrolase superfamily lysophospholipase